MAWRQIQVDKIPNEQSLDLEEIEYLPRGGIK
jgi:hypothetical protein